MADEYRTFIGIVQFDPREGEAGGKKVRNITIRGTGVKEQALRVGATLWPSHGHVKVEKGDAVLIEGKFSRNKGSDSDGNEVVYNNVSVARILVLGATDEGKRADVVNEPDDADDDDIPY